MLMIKQLIKVTAMNLRGLSRRATSSFVIFIGIAGVVGVLVSMLAMSRGLNATLAGNHAPDQAIVMSKGAANVTQSNLSRDHALIVAQGTGIKPGADGQSMAAPRAIVN